MINLYKRMLPTSGWGGGGGGMGGGGCVCVCVLNPWPPGLQSDGASNWATEAGSPYAVKIWASMYCYLWIIPVVLISVIMVEKCVNCWFSSGNLGEVYMSEKFIHYNYTIHEIIYNTIILYDHYIKILFHYNYTIHVIIYNTIIYFIMTTIKSYWMYIT